ncbi:hypothetical protein T10_3329 [Trichinella papuae]|uniref:Uncharacterized protein n=1 Tax=Trichinella papuae TaxID=268474 RepID=A0A0V1MFY3_9BILA|nr:hypothetical protein T10_3329 [Trichinella papuae]
MMMRHNCNFFHFLGSTGHDNGTRAGNDTRSGNNTRATNNARAGNVPQGQHYNPYSHFTIKGLPSNVTTAESPHFNFQYWQNVTDSHTEAVAFYQNEREAQWCRERFRNVLTFNFNTT